MFLRDGDTVYRTLHTNGRGTEQLGHATALADILPFGRQEEWQDVPGGWPQRPTYGHGATSQLIAELYGESSAGWVDRAVTHMLPTVFVGTS